MRLDVFFSSIGVAVVFICLLAVKWRVSLRTAAFWAVVIGAATGLLLNLADAAAGPIPWPMLVPAEFGGMALITFIIVALRFYRDPERVPAETGDVVISPADGKVVSVKRVEESSALVSTKGFRQFKINEITATDLLSDAAYLIGIDMNVLNVHVNRAPIAGTIVLKKRVPGSFVSLRREESETVNERVTSVISNGRLQIGVIQIASRLVRRIVSPIKEGDQVRLGQRIGAIVFGSQVDVVFSRVDTLRVEVKPGDEVKAGVTVIARY